MRRFFFPAVFILMYSLNLFSGELPPLKKSVTWERLNSNPAPLPVLGQLVPVRSDINMDSWWSIGCETLDRDYSNFDNYVQYVGMTGVGYARIQSGWAKCEPQKGHYDFQWLDHIVDGLREQGVKPWICLCYGNPAYSDDGYDLNSRIFGEGEVMEAWERYVRAVVERYRGKVSMYEVWNEPDGSGMDTYDTYAVLFQHTATAIRSMDQNVRIAAFGICDPSSKYTSLSLKKMQESGCIDQIDYITYHAYRPRPEDILSSVRALRAEIGKYTHKKIEILQGETGCPGQLEYGHAMSDIEWNEISQVKWDLRQMAGQFGMGVPYSVFTMVDLNYGWMHQSFGLVRMNLKHVPIYLRPKFYGVQNMTSVLTREFTASEPLDLTCDGNREYTVVGLSRCGKTVGFMIWFSGDRPSDSLEREKVNLDVNGLSLDAPVYVDMVTGKVHSLLSGDVIQENGNIHFKNLPLWDVPVLIIDKHTINCKEL